jgi:phosphoserine phosphatase
MDKGRPKLVCFDLDGTVMLRPNSLQYLLLLNNAPPETLLEIDRREMSGETDWISADYERAAFIAGLPVAAVEQHFDAHLETIGNLENVLRTFHEQGIVTILITAGPIEVAHALARRFPFDHCFGSTFETAGTEHAVYTGRIARHLGSEGKVQCLAELCATRDVTLQDCAAVGDGDSDLALFQAVGTSIGLNCSAETAAFAHHEVHSRDLSAILPLISSAGVGAVRRRTQRDP